MQVRIFERYIPLRENKCAEQTAQMYKIRVLCDKNHNSNSNDNKVQE